MNITITKIQADLGKTISDLSRIKEGLERLDEEKFEGLKQQAVEEFFDQISAQFLIDPDDPDGEPVRIIVVSDPNTENSKEALFFFSELIDTVVESR